MPLIRDLAQEQISEALVQLAPHRDGSAVLKLDDSTFNAKAEALGVNSALMIVSDYYGELVVTGDLTPRRACWFLSVFSFLYIVYELSVGLSAATEQEPDKVVKEAIKSVQLETVISWCTYPVVYIFPCWARASAA